MESKSIKHRLLQGKRQKSPPFLLEQSTEAPTLKPKKLQQSTSATNLRPQGLIRPGRTVVGQLASPEGLRRRPEEVEHEKLSKEARSMVEEGKQRIRSNLHPHDIFQLYASFPEMLEDFFYLNRREHPYDYQIVTYAQRNPQEYMTISSQGVTLYHDKEAEFLTQHQWLADQKRYFALQKISFFRQYKLSKNFRIWKNRMRRHYMREMSGILNEHLFLTMHYPRLCLLEIKHYTNCLKESLSFFPFESLDRLIPSEFKELLDEHREKTVLSGIRNTTEAITLSLEKAVSEEINKFRAENNIKIEGVNEGKVGNKEGYVYSQEAILKKQYKRVYKLIKLADGILQEAKIEMILLSLHQLLQKIQELPSEEREPWVTCQASLDEHGQVHWQPGKESLCSLFLETVKQHVSQLNERNQKIVNNPIFVKYHGCDNSEGRNDEIRTSLKAMVEESPVYFELLSSIEMAIGQEFDSTAKEELHLQRYIEVFLRHKSLEDMSTIFSQSTGVDLCTYVEQWKQDEKTMAQLPEEKKGSLLLYNYSALRKHIIGIPRQTLTNFFALLPQETSLRSQELTIQARTLLESISNYPTDIVTFAKFNKSVRMASERLDDIRAAGSEICLLIDLMGKNKLGNLEAFNAKKVETLNAINALKAKVEQSEAKENESLSRFKRDNELEITKIKATSKELEARFNGIQFNQVKATTREMKEILAKIKEILPPVKALESQATKITEIEHQLGLGQTDFSDIHTLYENTLLVNDTWTCRDDWKNLLVSLYHKHYTEVECPQLRTKWEEFEAKITALSRTLPDNDILKNLSQELGEVEVLIDTVTALTSPNLDQKSWREISEYLAYQLGIQNEEDFPFREPTNASYTVKWLLELNVPVYKERIEFIVHKSQKEKELVVQLNDIRNYLAALTFETLQRKNQFYLFGDNLEIKDTLTKNLAHLYAMLGSQYSPSVQNQAETLIRHYQYVQEITKAVLDFSSFWTKYEPFFDPGSPALKFLSKENKEFGSWEAQWKKIIKNITSDCVSFYRRVCDETLGMCPSRSTIKQISKTNTAIETIRKGLDEYLERKRSSFPRYYFVADEELLGMLGRVDPKEPVSNELVPVVFRHLKKIEYREESKDTLIGVVSREGEVLELKPINFKLQSEMEEVFKLTEEQIKKRLNFLFKSVFIRYSEEEITRSSMILDHNVQVVLVVDLVAWVRLAEETYLTSEPLGDLYDWIAIQQEQIRELTTFFNRQLAQVDFHKLTQTMSQSLYLLEKTREFLRDKVSSTESYDWERIPKLCLSSNNSDVYYKQLGQKLNYCYEFLGSSSSLSFIEPSTERVWLNISQALANKDVVCLRSKDQRVDTLRKLAFLLGQEVQQVAGGEGLNFKVLELFVNGGLGTGHWILFNWPQTSEMLTFLANQLNNAKKVCFEVSFEKTKSSLPVTNNLAFFLAGSQHQICHLKDQLAPFSHRDITLYGPSWKQVCCILSACHSWPEEASQKVVGVLEVMRDCFEKRYSLCFSHVFAEGVFRKVMSLEKNYRWLREMKCKEYFEYVTCEVLDDELVPVLGRDDVKVYEILKTSIIPDYEKYQGKHPTCRSSSLRKSLASFLGRKKLSSSNEQYLGKLEAVVRGSQSDLIGVIVCGSALCGKSTLISLAGEYLEEKGVKVSRQVIYHNAYSSEQLLVSEKGILPKTLANADNATWVVLDGSIPAAYLELFSREADFYLVPQLGILPRQKNLKFIIETYDISTVSPAIVGNHSVVVLGEEAISPEQMLRKELAQLEARGLTLNLTRDTVEYLIVVLSGALSRLENKNSFKSKSISFSFPLSSFEISYRCCRLLRAVFLMNWESIRDKEKSSKRVIDRLVSWLLYWSLLGIVLSNDQAKLEKYVGEVTKADNFGPDELPNSIIYPNCGLEVQLMSGLRSQSSLGIPEKGIITNVLRADLAADTEPSKNNKFFEEIVISEVHLIRVNYEESNRFNYVAQLAALESTPVMLFGPQNSGKKTIVELYSKNMRSKSQIYSIRFKNRHTLTSQIEKPFRRLNGLGGIIMKSINVSKKIIISIQDLSLDSKHADTSEMLRMLFKEGGYFNSDAQWVNFANCNFTLIASKISNEPDCLRLLPQLSVFQTSSNSYEKLHSIFHPYLKNWAAFNGLNGEVEKIFSSDNGDTLLDGILSIYRLLDGLYQADGDQQSLTMLLARPRIGDISKVLTYICRTPEANHYNMAYYYELWAHEVIRVFGDRLRGEGLQKSFFKEMKKEALIKFKENFSVEVDTMFIFTSLGIENQNCYIRVEDPAFLHNYISNLLEADQITLPLKYLFNELLTHLLRIYRVMAVEGAHIMLLGANPQTLTYLIQLTCQVAQHSFFTLRGIVTAEEHIEPTLYFKENSCLNCDVDDLSEETVYQMACLLNGNVYELEMSPITRERIKSSLFKKEKVEETGKKETKVFGKTKNEQKVEQKEEDTEQIILEQFMTFAHFVLQASPSSPKARRFLQQQPDIVGKLHYSWVDLPEASLVKVAKQILSFDQEGELDGHSDEKLIEKVRKVYWSQGAEARYFNDFLTVCEVVKSQAIRMGSSYGSKETDIRRGRQQLEKVNQSVVQKELNMKLIHEELEGVNSSIELKSKEFEDLLTRINELQMNIPSEEVNSDSLVELKVAKEEIEIDLKLLRDKKEKLEPEKKKILKGIKIGNDYFDLFSKSFHYFDHSLEKITTSRLHLQDNLILIWAAVSFLPKVPAQDWLSQINQWIPLLGQRTDQIQTLEAVMELFDEFSPQPYLRSDVFCVETRIKIKTLFWLLNNYEESVLFGSILKVYDPKQLMGEVFQQLGTEVNQLCLLNVYKQCSKENRGEIEMFIKSREGYVLIQSSEGVDELVNYLSDQKMTSYLNRVIVLANNEGDAHIVLDCHPDQLRLSVQQFMLKRVNPGLFNERKMLRDQEGREKEKQSDALDALNRACANISCESETYIEEVSKCKATLTSIQDSLKNIGNQLKEKPYLSIPEFSIQQHFGEALRRVWSGREANLSLLPLVYQEALIIMFGDASQQMSLEEKREQLGRVVEFNFGGKKERTLQDHLALNRRWTDKPIILHVVPHRNVVEALEGKIKCSNMLVPPAGNQSSVKALYNIIPSIHCAILKQSLNRMKLENKPELLILIAEETVLKRMQLETECQVFSLLLQNIGTAKNTELQTAHRHTVTKLQKMGEYLGIEQAGWDERTAVMDCLYKNEPKLTCEADLLKLVLDIANLDKPEVEAVFETDLPALQLTVNKLKQHQSNQKLSQEKVEMSLGSPKEELPFLFNISEFFPSKDPLAIDLITACLSFNRKLKKIREKIHQYRYQWFGDDEVEITSNQVLDFHREYYELKKSLVKLQILSSSHLNTGNSAPSTKNILNLNSALLNLPPSMTNRRNICLIRCKFAKKNKLKLFNTSVLWKVGQENSSQEQCISIGDSVAIKVQAIDPLAILERVIGKESNFSSIYLIASPMESSHELESSNYSSVPVRDEEGDLLGCTVFGSDHLSQTFLGLKHAQFVISK